MTRIPWPKSIRRVLAGNTAAAEFDRLLRDHVPTLYRCAYRWTGASDRAEDLVQELLLCLYPKLDELRIVDNVRPWALRLMYRIFIDQLRRERSSPMQFGAPPANDALVDNERDELIGEHEEPPELVEQQLTQERIEAAWTQLAEEHRVVLSLHDIEGYSLVELSPLMEVPLGALKSRLNSARTRLHGLLIMERLSASRRVFD